MTFLRSQDVLFDIDSYSDLESRGGIRFYEDVPFSSVNRILSSSAVAYQIDYSLKDDEVQGEDFWRLQFSVKAQILRQDLMDGVPPAVRVEGLMYYRCDPKGQVLSPQMMSQWRLRAKCFAVCE